MRIIILHEARSEIVDDKFGLTATNPVMIVADYIQGIKSTSFGGSYVMIGGRWEWFYEEPERIVALIESPHAKY